MDISPSTTTDKVFVLLVVVCGAFLGAVVFGAVFEVSGLQLNKAN
jgi:hypothetical protein